MDHDIVKFETKLVLVTQHANECRAVCPPCIWCVTGSIVQRPFLLAEKIAIS